MENNTVSLNEEIQALKRENLFLRLANKRYKKQLASLRSRYKVIETPHLNGVEIFDSDDERLNGMFHMTITELANAIGVQTSEISNVLTDKGIIARAGVITYLCRPEEHAKYAFYKKVKLVATNRLHLYWNKDGVKFIMKLAVDNGVRPRKFLNLQ